MRTTIEIPDDLFRRAKVAAAERGATLRQLVVTALQETLRSAPTQPDARQLPTLPPGGRKTYNLSNEEIEAILTSEEMKAYGRSR